MRNLTQAEAMIAYRRICRALGETPANAPVEQGDGSQAWYAGPVLCRDYESWSTASRWAIVWEGGTEDWAIRMADRLIHDPKVFAEPIQSFSLGLYPAGS